MKLQFKQDEKEKYTQWLERLKRIDPDFQEFFSKNDIYVRSRRDPKGTTEIIQKRYLTLLNKQRAELYKRREAEGLPLVTLRTPVKGSRRAAPVYGGDPETGLVFD